MHMSVSLTHTSDFHLRYSVLTEVARELVKSRSKSAIHFSGIIVNFAKSYVLEFARSSHILQHRGHRFAGWTPVSIEVDDDIHVA
jgi:hypothetical protein